VLLECLTCAALGLSCRASFKVLQQAAP
jgi:hypothetical protein